MAIVEGAGLGGSGNASNTRTATFSGSLYTTTYEAGVGISLRTGSGSRIETNNFGAGDVYYIRFSTGSSKYNTTYGWWNRQNSNGCSIYQNASNIIQLANLEPLTLGNNDNSYHGTLSIYVDLFDRNQNYICSALIGYVTVLSRFVSLTISGVNTTYWVKQKFSTSNIIVKANRETGEQVDVSNYSTNIEAGYQFTTDDMGEKTLTISAKDVTASYTLNVYGLEKIELSGVVSKFKQNSQFAFGNPLVVKAYWTDGSSKTLGSSEYSFSDKSHNLNDVLAYTGEYSFTVKYTDNVHSTGMSKSATASYSVYGLSEIVLSEDNTLSFECGSSFSFDKTITANYTDGTSEEISKSSCTWNGDSWSTFSNKTFGESDIGNKAVDITYVDQGVSKTVTQNYVVVGLQKLAFGYNGETEITQDPGKYFIGATYPSTIQAIAVMSDGNKKEVTATVSAAPDMTTSGTKDVTISYTEGGITKTKTFSIKVLNIEVESIDSVKTGLTKSLYKTGEMFSKTGLKVNITYNNEETDVVEVQSTSLDGHVFTGDEAGTVGFTVKVGDITKDLSLSVVVKKLTSITLTGNLGGSGTNYNEYAQGSTFITSGIKFTKAYSNGDTETNVAFDINDKTMSITPASGSKLLTGGANTVTLSITEGDVSVPTTSTLYVKAVSSIYVTGTLKEQFDYGDLFTLGTGVKVFAKYAGSHFDDEELTTSQYSVSYPLGTAITQKSSREITITYGVASLSYTIHVRYLYAITSISGVTQSFYQGDRFDFGSSPTITVKWLITDGTDETETVSLSSDEVSCNYNENVILTSKGNQTVYVRYTDNNGLYQEITYIINVVEDNVDHITLTLASEKVTIGDNSYFINNARGNILLNGSIESYVDENEDVLIDIGDTTYVITDDGTHYIFTDEEENAYTSTTITGDDLVGYTKFYQEYSMFYKDSRAVVVATYDSGKTVIVPTTSLTASQPQGSTFLTTGTKVITITYEQKTATYEVTVVAHEVESISLITTNIISAFAIGDKFNCSGLIVKAVYNSGYTKNLELGTAGYSISPANGYIFIDSDLGSKTVTVTYGNFTQSYYLTIGYPVIDYAEIDLSSCNLQPRNGDTWNPDNISVKLHYTNGLVKSLTRTTTDSATLGKFFVNVTPLKLVDNTITFEQSDSLGAKTISVKSYGYYQLTEEQNDTFIVTVLPNGALQNIYVERTDTRVFRTGETFTGEGFKIKAKLLDYNEYVEVDVANNVNVITNPAKGSTIYKAGQIDIVFSYTLNNVVQEATYTINVVPSYSKDDSKTVSLKIVRMDTFDTTKISLQDSGLIQEEANALQKNKDGKLWLLFDKNDTDLDDGVRVLKDGYVNLKCYGYVLSGSRTEDTDITSEVARVVLFEDYNPPIEGNSNIEVLFKRTVKGNADKINLCRDITLYGYKTFKNRAFVSGNSKLGLESCDFHSEPVNVAQTENYEGIADQDLTYFPDTGYTQVGNGTNKIIGEEILNNGYMVILKTESKQEPTVYFRHCEMGAVIKSDGSTAFDANGNQLYEERYEVEPGNMGDGGISKESLINFYGDTLFLTKKGLMGIDIGNATSLTDDTKYATERSYLINKKLKKADLENAFLYKFNDYLLLATNLGVFIANYYDKADKQYEWMLLGNIKARTFFEYEDELYFGTEDGELCKFAYEDTYRDYTDKSRTYIGQGGVLPISIEDTNNSNKIIISATYKDSFKNGDLLSVISSSSHTNIYALVGNFVNNRTLVNNALRRSDYQGIIDMDKGYFKLEVTYDGEVESESELPLDVETGDIYKVKETGDLYKYNGESYDLIGNDYDDYGFNRTQQLRLLLVDDRKVFIDQIRYVDDVAENRVGTPYTLVTKDREGNDLPPYCFLLRREDGAYADLDNLELCRISFQIPDNSEIVNKEVNENTGLISVQIKGDHDLILDLIQYDNQEIDSFMGVITKKSNVESYYVTKPFDFDEQLNFKNIFYWLVINDSDLASHTDLGYLINSEESLAAMLESGVNVDLGTQISEIEADLGKMSLESWTFDVNRMPKYYKSSKQIEDIENIAFVFRNFDDTNIVLTNLTIEYTVGVTID